MEMLTRPVYVLEDQGMTCLTERAAHNTHGFSLHAGLHGAARYGALICSRQLDA